MGTASVFAFRANCMGHFFNNRLGDFTCSFAFGNCERDQRSLPRGQAGRITCFLYFGSVSVVNSNSFSSCRNHDRLPSLRDSHRGANRARSPIRMMVRLRVSLG